MAMALVERVDLQLEKKTIFFIIMNINHCMIELY